MKRDLTDRKPIGPEQITLSDGTVVIEPEVYWTNMDTTDHELVAKAAQLQLAYEVEFGKIVDQLGTSDVRNHGWLRFAWTPTASRMLHDTALQERHMQHALDNLIPSENTPWHNDPDEVA